MGGVERGPVVLRDGDQGGRLGPLPGVEAPAVQELRGHAQADHAMMADKKEFSVIKTCGGKATNCCARERTSKKTGDH